jgi:hypothetical protein
MTSLQIHIYAIRPKDKCTPRFRAADVLFDHTLTGASVAPDSEVLTSNIGTISSRKSGL